MNLIFFIRSNYNTLIQRKKRLKHFSFKRYPKIFHLFTGIIIECDICGRFFHWTGGGRKKMINCEMIKKINCRQFFRDSSIKEGRNMEGPTTRRGTTDTLKRATRERKDTKKDPKATGEKDTRRRWVKSHHGCVLSEVVKNCFINIMNFILGK